MGTTLIFVGLVVVTDRVTCSDLLDCLGGEVVPGPHQVSKVCSL